MRSTTPSMNSTALLLRNSGGQVQKYFTKWGHNLYPLDGEQHPNEVGYYLANEADAHIANVVATYSLLNADLENRILELEEQLAGANKTIALFLGPDGERQVERFADALKNEARYRWIRSADPMTCDPELLPTLDTTALDDGIDAALALMVSGS